MLMKRLGALAFAGAMMLGSAAAQTNPGTSPLSVPKGGSGVASFTAKCVPYGNGTGPLLCALKVNSGILTFASDGTPTPATALPSGFQIGSGVTLQLSNLSYTGSLAAANVAAIPNTSGSVSSAYGVVKVDGTTITATSGVLSAAVGSAAAYLNYSLATTGGAL